MSTQEEKEWLRDILEGSIKPGDPRWEKIWHTEDFNGIRQVLHKIGMQDGDHEVADKKKMWAIIDNHCRKTARQRIPVWQRVAAIAIPFLLIGALYPILQHQKTALQENTPVIEAGIPQAILFLENGEKINLTGIPGDTVLTGQDISIRIDSSKRIEYKATETPLAEETEYNTIVVPRRGEYQLVLADGSKIYLNSESELRYPTRFTGKERRVYLKGEGYFQVARDTTRPFIVSAGVTDVSVLGTSFNVQAYDTNKSIRTTLVSGKVEVCNRTTRDRQLLRPGQQALWQPGEMLTVREVNVENYISWIDGKFYFSGSTLEEISEQMQRWYDLEFFFTSEELKHYAFVGVIDKEQTANKVFSMIGKTTHVKFELKGRTVTVWKADR